DYYGVPYRAPRDSVIGDAWHRFYVRMLEVVESIKLVRQGLERYPTASGSHRIEQPRHLPPGEAYAETECPRGAMGFYVVGAQGARSAASGGGTRGAGGGGRARDKRQQWCQQQVDGAMLAGDPRPHRCPASRGRW